MTTIILSPSVELPIRAFFKNYSKEKDNEQVWTEVSPSKLEFVKLEVYRDRIVAEDSNTNKYTVLPKSSKKNFPGDVLFSDAKNNKAIPAAFQAGSIKLQWKTYNSTPIKLAKTTVSDAQLVIDSLENNFVIRSEVLDDEGNLKSPGFRSPQIGAIYAILSNWAISSENITIVLPTGTGKSESILGTIIARKILRSLIIVPSDGLRNQFYNNCQSWGILRQAEIIDSLALNPIVCKLASSPKDEKALIEMIEGSNIIIATASILGKLKPTILNKLNQYCDVLFIDEAHHSAAPTWDSLKGTFNSVKIIQFTATPFREDSKPITGKIAFNYPLEEAQKNKYFTKIEFIPVVDYDPENWDKTISEKAVEILRKDISEGAQHILMARVDNISKAKEIFTKYYEQYTEFNPILITSKSASASELIDKLRKGESKIVVCVNMLGEGIDIPQLKIAALHDIRKSLTVTLQFIGRFTRSNKSTSPAKIVANIADVQIEKKLKQLYKEDADWGKLIAFASAKEIQKKIKFQELLTNFKESKIPLFNVKPKLSAVVYKAKDDGWRPEEVSKYLEDGNELFLCDLNEIDNIAIAIYQVEGNIDWLDSKIFVENTWEMLLFYFDKERKLLYANSSLKNVEPELIYKTINVDYKFDRESPFKCYHGLGHVVLFTLGVDKNTDSPIKYAMYAGDDIIDGITDMEKNKSSKSNTYGYGFKDGEELTLGASKYGKIWSRLIGNVQEWKEWCDEIGSKLTDDTIVVGDIFKGFLQPNRFDIDGFLKLEDPISIDFPGSFYQENESVQILIIDGVPFQLNDLTLNVAKSSSGYEIELEYESGNAIISLQYDKVSFDYAPANFKTIEYQKKNKVVDFIEFLKENDAFKIRLRDGTFIENNYHFKPYNPEVLFPLDTSLLTSANWSGIDLSTESMGLIPPYLTNSVQHKIYTDKESSGLYDIIINDDNAGEAADLLCFGVTDDRLIIEAIHCKYNISGNPIGSRINDFYVLCGQAQKTIKNFSNILRLFDHIKHRDTKTTSNGGKRFLKGDLKSLELLIKGNSYRRPQIKVILVQPGLSKAGASRDVLELLGSTYTLLKETLNAEFEVICS